MSDAEEAKSLKMSDKKLLIYTRKPKSLPFRENPVRFAVRMKNGLTSNAWGVKVEEPGDVYIYCRDNMKEVKISLHQSGKQHVAFTKGSGHEMTPGSRFWNQWREPPAQRPPVPTFKLVFPGWAISLNEEDRKLASATWDRNDIFIEGDDKLLTVVSFFIMDEGRVPQQQGLPSKAIGILPLREGKDLCVLASYELERNFKSVVEKGVKRLFTNPRMINPRAFAKALLSEGDSDRRFSACLTGDQPEGYAYLVMIPVGMK